MPTPSTAAEGEKPSTENRAEFLRDEGSRFYAQGDYTKAIAHFEIAGLIEPSPVENWYRYLLCYSYLYTGQLNEALAAARELVTLEPYSPLAYQQLGLVLLWAGQPKSALTEFHKSLEFDSHYTSTHFYSGLAFHILKNTAERDKAFSEAEKEYELVLQKNPKDLSANYELASLLLFANRDLAKVGSRIQNVREGLLTTDETSQDRRLFQNYYLPLLEGIYAFRRANADLAVEKLLSALPHVPAGARADLAEVYHYLSLAYLARGESDKATPFLEKGIDLDPNGVYASEMRESIRGLASQKSTSP